MDGLFSYYRPAGDVLQRIFPLYIHMHTTIQLKNWTEEVIAWSVMEQQTALSKKVYRVPKWWRHKYIFLKLWDMMSYSYRGSWVMLSYQKLALNCNSRWRYKGSKFDSIPYKPFKICSGSFSLEPAQKLERFIWGSIKLSSFIFRLGITIKR